RRFARTVTNTATVSTATAMSTTLPTWPAVEPRIGATASTPSGARYADNRVTTVEKRSERFPETVPDDRAGRVSRRLRTEHQPVQRRAHRGRRAHRDHDRRRIRFGDRVVRAGGLGPGTAARDVPGHQ